MHTVQLDPTTGLRLASNTTVSNIAYRYWGEEGSFIYYWNGYYYYFGSINPCCSATSTYRIVYGRSTSPSGPFVDRGGRDLSDNGGTILLSTHSNIVGPGGESVFTMYGAVMRVQKAQSAAVADLAFRCRHVQHVRQVQDVCVKMHTVESVSQASWNICFTAASRSSFNAIVRPSNYRIVRWRPLS